jgi:hypothetical protein
MYLKFYNMVVTPPVKCGSVREFNRKEAQEKN